MFTRHIALVSETPLASFEELARVSSALQRQVVQDLAPIWEVSATVDPFPSLEEIPAGYWPLIITTAELDNGLLGAHIDENGQPAARVEWSDSWSITASHECLEMLVDPWQNALQTARSPVDSSERVEYLVEVCDPCQHAAFAYTVNDVLLSEFYTPAFFDRAVRSGVRYSLTGAINQPLKVLEGGYISYRKLDTGDWYQVDAAGKPRLLGKIQLKNATLRQNIDRMTPLHLSGTRLSKQQVEDRVSQRRAHAKQAGQLRAAQLRAHRTSK